MKVAIVVDWLVKEGGAEKVLAAVAGLFPRAQIFTTIYDLKGAGSPYQGRLRGSFLQKIPFANRFYKILVPLMPLAVGSLNLKDFDLVISLSHTVAHGVITRPSTRHLAYIHTPMRWAWLPKLDQRVARNFLASWILPYLRTWDALAGQRPKLILANSKATTERIRRFWGRKADEVIYPPVEVGDFRVLPQGALGNYFLWVGRLIAYKRPDLAVEAFRNIPEKLVVVGEGPERKRLAARATSNVTFTGSVSRQRLAALYARAQAVLFTGEEDFGIVPLEAMASGRPVIAFKAGGAVEVVREGISGLFFEDQTPAALRSAISRFGKLKFDPRKIRRYAEGFSRENFEKRFKKAVSKLVG